MLRWQISKQSKQKLLAYYFWSCFSLEKFSPVTLRLKSLDVKTVVILYIIYVDIWLMEILQMLPCKSEVIKTDYRSCSFDVYHCRKTWLSSDLLKVSSDVKTCTNSLSTKNATSSTTGSVILNMHFDNRRLLCLQAINNALLFKWQNILVSLEDSSHVSTLHL